MKRTTSFHLEADTVAYLDSHSSENERSGTLQRIVARYAEVCRRDRPALSVPEWKLVCDALNGTALMDAFSPAFIPVEVADGIRLNKLGEKWDVDGAALGAKFAELTYGQLVAVADVAEMFWRATAAGEDPKVPGERATQQGKKAKAR